MTEAALAGLIGLALGAGAMLLLLPVELFGHVPPLDGTLRAGPADVAVIDGGTIQLDTTLVRLGGVAAPPRGRACQGAGGRPAFDCGAMSARALAGIIRGQELTCQLHERDARGFAQAHCTAGATDVNAAIVAAGWARAETERAGEAPVLAAAERAARAARVGLWADADLTF